MKLFVFLPLLTQSKTNFGYFDTRKPNNFRLAFREYRFILDQANNLYRTIYWETPISTKADGNG